MSRGSGPRRTFLIAAVSALLVGCRSGPRCRTCGMKIDPTSAWVGYVTLHGREEAFDTPSCAFSAWRKAGAGAERAPARFREYYSQQLKPAEELRFVRGSDVLGPMGPDLVPIDTATAGRFAREHNGAPPQTAENVVKGEP